MMFSFFHLWESVHATGHTIANIANHVYTQNRDKIHRPSSKWSNAIIIYYFTMQLYLQYSSILQNIDTQGKQCNMLHYTTLNRALLNVTQIPTMVEH